MEKLSSRVLSPNRISSPKVFDKNKNHESKSQHSNSSNIEQKIHNLRMRMHGNSLPTENNPTTQIPITEPLKPMRYVRHFTVSVSLKKSRLLRLLIV